MRTKKRRHPVIQILPYENTYGRFYHPDELPSVEPSMIEKIIYGVQAMAATLTNPVGEATSSAFFRFQSPI
jgi:hypothetical protein